ncbi:hypothetical protein [Natronococcus sp. A-GB7]|uniref:hypothetical protein n=1 Tax=Natronococcus sp. A-GB7 TaxID=3037649 RepID=UPI00241D31A9|nr:hypothetical protein [Natronococcus sp. A-GB7]MDG5819579.1 hypothetical protein [Natronococcus sp. A-GB7]
MSRTRSTDAAYAPSSLLLRELVLGLVLLTGTHLFVVDVRAFASIGAAIPLVAGVATGPLLLMILRRTNRPSVGFAGLVALSVVAAAASWAAGAAVAGTEAEAARIPAFGIGLLVGSIALRLADERHRTVGW